MNYLELLLMLLIMLGLMFIGGVQPMFMVSILILIVLLYSWMLNMMVGGYWFSYALVLVMLSGVLVVFTYMVSLIPNESFEGYNVLYIMGMLMILMEVYYVWEYNLKVGMFSLVLWNSYYGIFIFYMVSFLLLIMLMVVWLGYLGCGALRINY